MEVVAWKPAMRRESGDRGLAEPGLLRDPRPGGDAAGDPHRGEPGGWVGWIWGSSDGAILRAVPLERPHGVPSCP